MNHPLCHYVTTALVPLIAACIVWLGPTRTPNALAQSADSDTTPPDSKDVAPEKANLHHLLDEAAGKYAVFAGPESTETLKLHCILRWANQTRGSVDGATYIWTERGRPIAAVCCYPWYDVVCDNFQSLARGPLRAEREGQIVWRPKTAGVEFQRVPGGPAPAESTAARLRQMKTLARGFSATLLGWAPGDPDREELRLLPQPVYRYECEPKGLLDGALFAFVQGTDPEALLMLEAVPTGSGQDVEEYDWQFALVRRTSGWLEVRYDDQIVWKAEKDPEWRDPSLVYFQLSHPLPPDALDTEKKQPSKRK
jgi:hypothetical protein